MRFSPEKLWDDGPCTGCGTCAEVCPTGAVTLSGGRPSFDLHRCIGCGHCGAWCPENCFHLEPETGGGCSPEAFRRLAASRRSVRRFSRDGITDGMLEELLSVVGYSPTGVNAQGIRVVHRRGEAVKSGLSDPLSGLVRRLRITGLPWLAGRLSGYGKHLDGIASGEDPVFRGAPLVLFFFTPRGNPTASSDGVIAAATVMHQATAMGLGSFWNGVARLLYPLVGAWHRGAPGGGRLAAVLCVGRPLEAARQRVPQRDWESVGTD